MTDVDNVSFAGGKLTVLATSGFHGSNRIELGGTLFNLNTSTREITRRDLVNGDKVIGTLNVNGGVGLTNFEVTFNGNATPGFIQQLMRALCFRTTSATSIERRILSFTLEDGSGGTSNVLTKAIRVS